MARLEGRARGRSAAVAVLVGLCITCAPTEKKSEHGSTETTAAVEAVGPIDGGTLVRRFESDIGTLNAVLSTSSYEKNVLSYIHDAILEIDKDHKLIAGLAERWEVSPDGRTYTFHIDPRATFSDGRPVRASDLVFTLKKIVDPKSESAQLAALFEGLNLKETVALNPTTARVVFDKVRAAQLLAFNIPVLPEHFYSRGNFLRDFNRKVVGSGPYVLQRLDAGKTIHLERRKNYWRTPPHIQTIVIKIIQEDAVAWNALRQGEIDESRLTSDQWKAAKDDKLFTDKIELKRFYPLSYGFLPWNTRDPLLSDKQVRRALAMCLDRRAMITSLFYGTARVMSGPFTPDQFAYNPQVKPIEFAPAQAKKILRDLGWNDTNGDGFLDRNGKNFEIEMLLPAGSTISASVGQVFQQGLKEAGVSLKLTTIEPSVMFERLFDGKYQTSYVNWDLDLDPDAYSLFHSSQFAPQGQNFVFYKNPQVDALLERARVELDQEKRTALFHELHALLAEEQPYTWVLQVSTKWGVNKRVHNVEEAEGLGLYLWYPGPLQWWVTGNPAQGKALAVAR